MRAIDLQTSFYDNKHLITVVLAEKPNFEELERLKVHCANGKVLDVDIKPFRKKRSVNANNYFWQLVEKIANILRTNKEELYIEMLKRYGQREKDMVSVVEEAVDIMYRATDNHCYVVGSSELNGKTFVHLTILRGSSTYNTQEMSILIDGTVGEAKELGIETLPPHELEKMKNAWKKQKVRKEKL